MKKDKIIIEGPEGTMQIDPSDKLAVKLAMVFEGSCLSKHPTKVAAKYGYSKQRYYQILSKFKEGGSAALKEMKKGPKENRVRTEVIVNQILRHKFLDPDSPAEVIAQKITQAGHKISTRSVERTITEYGLQKKTLFVKSGQKAKESRDS
jgi:transposase